jgi:hypothetical protein
MSNNIFLYNGGKLTKFGSEKLPESQVKNNIDWVIYGTKEDWVNRQPQYYDYLSKTSPKNTAILKTKNRQVYGKGLEVFDTPFLKTNDKIALETFIKKTKDSRVTQRIVSDRNKYNGFAVEIIFDKKGEMIMPHHVPFEDVRVSKKVYNKEGELEPTQYYYTSDWSLGQAKIKSAPDFTVFEEFDWNAESYDKSKRYLIYYKGEEYIQEYYPLPDYLGGIPYVSADTEVANFVENNVKNGFTGGYLVNFFNGDPDDDAKKEIVDQFDEVLHGTDNAGKSIKSFNENKDSGVEVTPLSANGQDDRYKQLNEQIRDEIFTAHTINPIVVGMKGESGFNNNADERRVAVEDFIENYIKPVQDIFNELFNNIIVFNEMKGMVFLQRLDPIKQQLPVERLFEIANRDELRDIYRANGWDLKETDTADETVSTALKEINLVFSKDDDLKICEEFSKCGTMDSDIEYIDGKELYAKDVFDAQRQGELFRQEFANKLESAVLSLLNGNNQLTPKDISDLTGESTKGINEVIKSLEDNGLLSEGSPTQEGQEIINQQEVFVVYKYKKRADAPKLQPGGESRDFCKKMVQLSLTRSWSIEDIQLISAKEGYDVFTRRGGWYHNPDLDVNTPYCRHIWEQRLVRRK